ncbi:MlaD family protein [Chitinispirillales bacterium ANBcel5]|uniref:MlaD family protein n=1 Tax=Cellulosispirillum alkaliphilum TaxID=3039283 RepID=UPI002A50F4E3|nr:MlaD family protein [Chitinispirillales bacterium ANBcel5]
MRRSNVDLVVGASILLAILILVSGVLWLKESSLSRSMVTYTALFENVGTLQVGDPVLVNGVNKGVVTRIDIRGTEVAVVLSIDRDITLTDSTSFVVQNIGLMGERGVGVQLTGKGVPLQPNTTQDTAFVRGRFDSGIAEAMGMLGTVLGEVETLTGNVTAIVENTIGDTAFSDFYYSMITRLDTISRVTERLLRTNEPLIEGSIRDITKLSADLKTLVEKNSGNVDQIIEDGAALSSQALEVVSRVDTLSVSMNNIVGKIERGEGALGQLIQDEELYPELKKTLTAIDTLVNEIQNDALRVRLRLGFGRKRR